MDYPGDMICGLRIAHDIGDLDDEDLQLSVASLENACARGFLAGSQILPNRLEFSSLCDDVCLRRFRFTRRQIHSLYNALETHDFYVYSTVQNNLAWYMYGGFVAPPTTAVE